VNDNVKVDVWADVMCPWCYIGKRRLEEAAAVFSAGGPGEGRHLDIEFHSFELASDIAIGHTQSVLDYNVNEKGMDEGDATALLARITTRARAIGLDLHFESALLTNTSLAHQLIHYAAAHGKQLEAEEALFVAYFTQGRNVSDIEELGSIAQELGLDRDDAVRALEADEFLDAVHADEAAARAYGINSVPFFVIDGKYAVEGVQSTALIASALETAWAERSTAALA